MPRLRSILCSLAAVTLAAGLVASDQPTAEAFLPRVLLIDRSVGDGTPMSGGDGKPARSASLYGPTAVAFARDGDMYIAEGNRVRRVDAGTGLISTIAGTGIVGDSGDGGPALNATIGTISDLAVDASENLFLIANGRIRRVDAASGTIGTFAGGGSKGLDGSGRLEANLFQAEALDIDSTGRIYFVAAIGIEDGRLFDIDPATGVIRQRIAGIIGTFNDVAMDSKDRAYVINGDPTSIRLEVWDPAKGFTTEPTLLPLAHLRASHLTIDRSTDTLYSATHFLPGGLSRIDAMNLASGAVSYVGGAVAAVVPGDRGPAASAAIEADDIALSPSGQLYIASRNIDTVRVITCGDYGTVYRIASCF